MFARFCILCFLMFVFVICLFFAFCCFFVCVSCFLDSIDVRMHVIVSLCHGDSNVRYYFSDLCMVLLISFSKAHQINTKTIDRFDFYPGQAKLHALNETICGFLCVLWQTH